MAPEPHIVVAGAGAIGCFVGGLLAAGGHRVTLLVRPRVRAEIRAHGLTLTDFSGLDRKMDADAFDLRDDPGCMGTADIVLVTVKSGATAEMGRLIAAHTDAQTRVISLQNGTENAQTLTRILPDHDVRAGMVPFNVVPLGQGCFHRATSGDIVIGAGPGDLAKLLSVPHLALAQSDDIIALQWGKFLINLNNAVNALSGLTLREQLQDRRWRRLMADQMQEALGILRASGISPASTTPVPVGLVPWVLRLPTPLFTRVAAQMLTIDAQARTSMAHDLMAGRKTEIDVLQGQVVAMGKAAGKPTPINARVHELVKRAETAAEGVPHLPVEVIRKAD
ncbi:2-dehydropantoate 2-reductase [Sulfitobacter sp. TSTF-M16]|uniref:2-dehydropantoate 2-reductase n=1 Tax=Sulfitobacter aestuariivivens TaxID=2766981 RepID=A0A927HEL0_9RHOB|nr:2-dehydropantoate 2-reductase [Sulfitobacter aestuariivivens]MBD3662320.1 2-dehydropantoate 2-reductase [Sulfitobacter aestuariivivens]